METKPLSPAVPLFRNLNPDILESDLLAPAVIWTAGVWELVTVREKRAELLGVFVPPPLKMIPFVSGMDTSSVQVTEPMQVNRTVSPSLAEEIAVFTAVAEQSFEPTV